MNFNTPPLTATRITNILTYVDGQTPWPSQLPPQMGKQTNDQT